MAEQNFNIKGLDTLQAEFLKLTSDKTAVKLGRKGTQKGAAYLRTRLRRAAPFRYLRFASGKQERMTRLIKSIVLRKPIEGGGIGVRVFANNMLGMWETGRKAYLRRGSLVSGSPQMKRFGFWHRTVRAEGEAALQITVDAIKAELLKEAERIAAATARGK